MSQMMPDPAPSVRELLAFYLEAGVDCALAEEPANRLAEPDVDTPSRKPLPVRPVRAAPVPIAAARSNEVTLDAAVASAREAARSAPTLSALRDLMERFEGCAL